MAMLFLSYSRRDSERAHRFAEWLRRNGDQVWQDSDDIGGGASFSAEIEKALRNCDAVLVLWSVESVRSAWVCDEAAFGRDSGKLIPLLLDGTEPPIGFRQFQSIDLSGWKGHGRPPAAERIRRAIDRIGSADAGGEERRDPLPVPAPPAVHERQGAAPVFRQPRLPRPAPRWLGFAIVSGVTLLSCALAWWHWGRPFDRVGVPAGRADESRNAGADPLRGARVAPLTDFEGLEQAAAISRDGQFAAFISDRGGQVDAWITQIGTGEFRNLTQGQAPELLNPEVRSVAFTPDGSLVTLWSRNADRAAGQPAASIRAVPTIGGAVRPYQKEAAEIDWSSDGAQVVFHTTDPGDPLFVQARGAGKAVQVYVAERGVHCHFPLWSPDDEFIYFTRGVPPDEMDLWRMRPDGTAARRLTFHNSRVMYPTFSDRHTLLYLATSEDGAGPWLYAFDVERLESRRISFGMEQYTSLAASADGRRLVTTVERSSASLWRVPIADKTVGESAATKIEVPTVGGFSPRVGPGYVLYVTPKVSGYAIWKLADGEAWELWSAQRARIVGGLAVSPDGKRIAFAQESGAGSRLYWMSVDAPGAQLLAESLAVRGAPAWSRDGAAITVAAMSGNDPRLFRVPVDGSAPVAIAKGAAVNPVWSSDGSMLIYADVAVGPTIVLKALNADGTPRELPPITLPRSSRHVSPVPGRPALVVLQGEMRHTNFWYVDLESGAQRQLTDFSSEYAIGDFDVTPAGEIVFDRRRRSSDIALIELQGTDAARD